MWRVAGDTESEDEEDESEYEDAHLPAGQASVSWLRRAVTANEDMARLRVLDRQVVMGDVVARAEGDAGQVRRAWHWAEPGLWLGPWISEHERSSRTQRVSMGCTYGVLLKRPLAMCACTCQHPPPMSGVCLSCGHDLTNC